MIKVDKGVPIPKYGTARRGSKYPIRDLLVGDSFAVPVPEGRTPSQVQTIVSVTIKRINIDGAKFTTRSLIENGERVIRCWRVE